MMFSVRYNGKIYKNVLINPVSRVRFSNLRAPGGSRWVGSLSHKVRSGYGFSFIFMQTFSLLCHSALIRPLLLVLPHDNLLLASMCSSLERATYLLAIEVGVASKGGSGASEREHGQGDGYWHIHSDLKRTEHRT